MHKGGFKKMTNEAVKKAKADVKKGISEVGKAAANLKDDVMADAKKLKANLEQNADVEKKADATRILVTGANTGERSDREKKQADAKVDTVEERDTIESIFGVNAGIVWNALNLNSPMTIDDLVKSTTLNPEEIYSALGWLGRENKISLETRGVVRFFSLRL
jgi:hypothetical protein